MRVGVWPSVLLDHWPAGWDSEITDAACCPTSSVRHPSHHSGPLVSANINTLSQYHTQTLTLHTYNPDLPTCEGQQLYSGWERRVPKSRRHTSWVRGMLLPDKFWKSTLFSWHLVQFQARKVEKVITVTPCFTLVYIVYDGRTARFRQNSQNLQEFTQICT